MNDLIAGVVSGVAGSVVEYPFDTVKTLMQTFHTPPYRNFWSTTKHVFSSDGLVGFYQGYPARMLASAVESACIFTAYKATLRLIGADVDAPLLWQIGLGGCGAGITATLCFTPLELIKCAMQADRGDARQHSPTTQPYSRHSKLHATMTSRQFASIWDFCVQTYRGDAYRRTRNHGTTQPVRGIRAFYRGGGAMCMREIAGTAVWCGTYDTLRSALTPPGLSPRELPLWKMMLAGGLSGTAFWSLLFPIDTVKTRMQVDTSFAQCTVRQALAILYKENGLRSLYRGFIFTVLRAFPSNAVIFSVYDICSHKLDLFTTT